MKIIKYIFKMIFYRPFNMGHLGRNSWFLRPRKLDGRRSFSVGNDCLIRENCWFSFVGDSNSGLAGRGLVIEDGVYIGRYSVITVAASISIKRNSVLSEHVYITDAYHGYEPGGGHILKQQLQIKNPVIIGENCFIGYRVSIMPGVELGNNCVVAASSVVTKSFPAYSMIGGVPAKLLKKYCFESRSWQSIKP